MEHWQALLDIPFLLLFSPSTRNLALLTLPRNPPICPKKSPFNCFLQGFGSDVVAQIYIGYGPIWALAHFPVFYQCKMIYCGFHVKYIFQPLWPTTLNKVTKQIHSCWQCQYCAFLLMYFWHLTKWRRCFPGCLTSTAAMRKPTCIAWISNSKRKR